MAHNQQPTETFSSIYSRLTSHSSPLLPPSTPHSRALTSQIAALQLHPTLESALHILNADLVSAHFLLRHMQSPPAWEGMFLHGILHRIEGDYDNARMWYSDVAKDESESDENIYENVWGNVRGDDGGEQGMDGKGKTFKDLGEGIKEVKFSERKEYGWGGSKERELDAGQRFLNAVQAFKETKAALRNEEVGKRLQVESKREIETAVEWCERKFGSEKWEDAREAWVVNGEEVAKASDAMLRGDKGTRKF
ncbi:hypothetical protein VTL71DRAFT_4027 [Oculimacula yallundae]|uniref:Uncharacterized protein n=1 Tax=Oculimacula yallundae TaxID=86028 RepID=A0ABR4C5E8_9HELO